MTPARVIQAVIDGAAAPADLRALARGIADGSVSDAQCGAFAMAVKLRGLSDAARTALTEGMRDSGDVLAWDLPGPVVDKHSTGGVGDCISLPLAPALAACGVFVPMVSGRGLGHTGGTLDKLEAIPGYTVDQPEDRFRAIVADVGCAIVGAGGNIAPADRRLYAVRDVTASVESVDLITASILSKKLAAGLQALVMDVKVGSGAFLPGAEQARVLARSLVDTANGAGCRTSALITGMDAPLGGMGGNALEVAEVMRLLTGERVAPDLWELTCALGGEALALAGIDGGADRVAAALRSGAAAERFGRMVAAQGGPVDFVERWAAYLPVAPVQVDVFADTSGTLAAIDTRAVGLAVVAMGGGRRREGDRIDHRVGFTDMAAPGAQVGPDAPLACVHAADEASAQAAAAALRAACRIGDAGAPGALVRERVA
ncbi:MAG: thymidine phosphorylase [Rhodobacteraceae bacterium]|nr:thymidine phosphorylase [Paracoccaceae bacterium]